MIHFETLSLAHEVIQEAIINRSSYVVVGISTAISLDFHQALVCRERLVAHKKHLHRVRVEATIALESTVNGSLPTT